MKPKQFVIADDLTIAVYKRASSRRIRLSIGQDGVVKVSIPKWLPYSAATSFAASKLDWIRKQKPEPKLLLPGRQVGKNHQLVFRTTDKSTITTRLNELEVVVFYPNTKSINDPEVQAAAKRVIKKALAVQAKRLLPIRLDQLAREHGFKYRSVSIKSLKTRWGSCDSHKNITLNLYLMELPWELIDYVLLHELNHTKIMRHGDVFWRAMKEELPNYVELKKQIKSYPTLV
jgi:hypothetical protein